MKKFYIVLLSVMVLVFPGVVNALGIDKSEAEVEVGKTTQLTISGWQEGYTAEWSSNNSGIATVEHNGESVKVTGVSAGTTAISVVIHDGDGNELDATPFKCDVTVNEESKSSDATLKSLSVKGQTLSPEFDKDTLDYTVTVSSDTTKITVEGEKNDDKATVDGLGEVTLKDDTTTTTVKVTAEDGQTTKEYIIKVTKEKKKTVSDFTLKKVVISGADIDPKFDKNTFEYTLNVKDGKTPKVDSYEASDKNAQVFVGDYKNGKLTITVTDGTKSKQYVFKVPTKEANVYLSKLEVKAYPFEEEFNKNVTKYTAKIPYEVEEVTLDAVAEDSEATVSVPPASLKNLKVGTNTITVTVKNGDKKKEYVIVVVRSKEEKLDEKSTSIISNKKSKNSKNSDYDIPDVESPDSVLNYITVTLASLMLFAAGGIGIYFFIKTSPKRLKKEAFSRKEAKNASPLIEAKPNNKSVEELDFDNDKNNAA